ncbi:MAG TPA: DNA primase [Magnetospirillum sp.]|nr:DNA primase [Magnetospirillum sp.]
MAFPPEFLDELRSRVSLPGIVGRRVKLVKRGREYSGLCPFHNEKSPSFTVNEDKGFFHCFGCGAHGDAISFEMRANHLGFTEAVERLAQELGLDVPKATPEERTREAKRASLHDAMEAACRFYETQLRSAAGRDGLAYLRDRGLSEDTIARFRLGWAPDSREALKKAVMSEACPESLLLEAGLLKKPAAEDGRDAPARNGASFDFFRGRVTFPVTDRRGRVVAFGARTLGDGQPKYLNSPDTPLFHKGSMLYGLAHARETAREGNLALAVEGYMDVIALHQAGFTYAVAPLGTALTEGQIEELWRLADEPILCFDGDAAGQRAMARAAERGLPILKPGKSLRFARLPHPEDPDSLIKAKGAAAMQAVLDAAQPLFDVTWALATEGRPLDTPERRAALEQELKEKAFGIADETVRWQYLSAFRERMKSQFRPKWEPRKGGQAFGQPGGKRFEAKRRPGDPPLRSVDGRLPGAGRPLPPASPQTRQERLLLSILIIHPPLVEMVAERLGEMTFADSELDKLRRGILKHLDIARDLDSPSLQGHLRSDGHSRVLDSLLDANAYKIARPDAVQEARSLWEHIFTLYTRKEIQADVAHAVENFAREPSEANFNYLAALLKSRGKGVNEDEERDP